MPTRTLIPTLKTALALMLLAALAAFFLLAWQSQLQNPEFYSTADFAAFFSAGRIAQTDGPQFIFDLDRQLAFQQQASPTPLRPDETYPFLHPPFILPLLWALVSPDYIGSFIRWGLCMLAFQVMAALALVRGLPPLGHGQTLLAAAGLMFFFPAQIAILKGQDTPVLLLGLRRGDDRLSGLGLALTTIRPHVALMLALPFLFKRRGVWWWFAAGSAALAAFSLLLLGVDGTRIFLQTLGVSASGVGYQLNQSAMVNILGTTLRAFPSLPADAARQGAWALYLTSILALCILWTRSKQIEERHAGLAVVLSVLTVPHLHYHDMALLSLPLSGILVEDRRAAELKESALAWMPLLLSMALWITFMVSPLYFPFLYLLRILLAGWLWLPVKTRQTLWQRLSAKSAQH